MQGYISSFLTLGEHKQAVAEVGVGFQRVFVLFFGRKFREEVPAQLVRRTSE